MNKYIEFTVIAGVFLLLLGAAFAASSQEAIDFVSKQNNFLTENEIAGIYPVVKISFQTKSFFVVTVLSSDNSLAGFIPVADATPMQLPDSLVARKELIKTAYVLRSEQKLKENRLIFDIDNQKFFLELADELQNETVDLTTIKTELVQYPLIQQDLDKLKEQLDAMRLIASETSNAIAVAIGFETEFTAKPDTARLSALQSKFKDSFDLIAESDALRSIYLADLDKAKQKIALTDLPIDTKRSLNSLADVPEKLGTPKFEPQVTFATDLNKQFNQIFSKADTPSFITGLTDDLATREKRNSAFQVLYGQSDDLMKKTGQQTLSNLVDFILQEDYVFKWIKQGSVTEMQSNWAKAETFYSNGSFEDAERYAGTAKEDAIRVYEGGMEDDGGFDTDLIFTGIILLIIALIVLFILKNRKKLFKLVAAKQEQEQELQIYDFEK
jgi:hypothetical protein